MLKNYLKITITVMRRRKMFTFITLFGISMTLSILIVLTAFYEHLFSTNYPEIHRDRSLYATVLEEVESESGGMRRGPMSISYINKYLKTLKTPEKVAFASIPNTVNTYGNGKKLKLFFKYSDPVFWEIMGFEFLEGKAFTQREIDNNESVAIINDQTRDDYFGKGLPALGKTIEINGQNLRVIGVVRGCPITRMVVAADVYLPYHLQKRDPNNQDMNGSYYAIVLARSEADLPAIQREYFEIVPRIPLQTYGEFKPDRLNANLSTYFDSLVQDTFFRTGEGSARTRFYIFISLFALLFMSLPAINLVNINISRILERSSEIGIRKAFGASSWTLVAQFVIENVLLTLFGGLVAILLSAGFLWWFNQSGLIDYADLTINWTVVLVALVLSLVFGLMSGVYPAWRMSRLPAVEALKG
ncbi:MAG: ABC transporter permease [Saprospiraceae bacterium]|nr:ABC transporter permease [Saprospiraceae bacterium]